MATSKQIINYKMYKKRPETAGIKGQFFKSKLLGLLNFRAQLDDDIEEFQLATNVDLIGEFDDICLRAKVKGFAKQIAMFVQCKHTETDKVLSLKIEQDLVGFLRSYLKIRRAFGTNKLFEGTFNDIECLFVVYTNATYDFNDELVETEYTTKLKELIRTSPTGSYLQPTYEEKHLETLRIITAEERSAELAELLANLLNKEVFMDDELVEYYHYLLAQEVFDISDSINEDGHRIASFRKYFFDTSEHFVLKFKNSFYEQVLLKRKIDETHMLNLLEKFFSTPTEVEVLSELIGTVITYKNGKFEFIKDILCPCVYLQRQLNKVSVPQSTVDEAIDQAARKILEQSTFKVPPSFGNKDLTIKGNEANVERRLDLLCSTIVGLTKGPKHYLPYFITIDDSLGDDLLNLNGGLAGAVGNVFVRNDKNKRLLQFADNVESGDLAKRLYLKLQTKIPNLEKYRIIVKTKKFPKLSFDTGEYDKNLVSDFLRRLIFVTNQPNEKEIDEILKQEIRDYPFEGVQLFQVKSDAIFIKYHNAIQEWWKRPDAAEYLTKNSKHFEDASKDIINQPLTSVLNTIIKFKMQKFKYTFNTEVVRAFERSVYEQCNTNVNVIVTDNCKFTFTKLIQYFNNMEYVVLELESISNLPSRQYKTLRTELAEIKETVIFVNNGNWCERFDDIVKSIKGRLFIITKAKPNKIPSVEDFANNLIDFSDESQQTFLNDTKMVFQDEEVSLSLLVKDENTMKLIKGDIFNEMLEHTIIKIGKPIKTQKYDDLNDLYIDRRLSRIRKTEEDEFHEVKEKSVQTLYDLQEDVILVTAIPGMGKSTLLTHLSIKTKELYPNTWIVRINLLEYSNIFNKWQKNKTVIDRMLSLYFMCCVALGVTEQDVNAELQEEENSVVSLKGCSGDASITFGFEMFLHFYNSGKLIFLFDGFDEIFPHYANEALSLLKSVRTNSRQNKIWITNRSYNDIKDILEEEFGRSYEIEPFSFVEQKTYIIKYWLKRRLFSEDNKHKKNISSMFVPCHHPVYAKKRFITKSSRKRIALPYFKINFNLTEVVTLVKAKGFVDDGNIFPITSNSNVEDDSINSNTHNDFIAIPLHLHLIANMMNARRRGIYTSKQSMHVSGQYKQLRVDEVYQNYVEAKLKQHFIENKKMEMSNRGKEEANFLMKHKMLGAYAIFYPDVGFIFTDDELKDVKETIHMLKLGKEKSGFICGVAGDIPLFIHRLIAEYFAAEYICGLLEADIPEETQKLILDLSKKGDVYEMIIFKKKREGVNLIGEKLLMCKQETSVV